MERVTKKIMIFSVTTNTEVEECEEKIKGKSRIKMENKNSEEENE